MGKEFSISGRGKLGWLFFEKCGILIGMNQG
jgi:hypothetical protein